MAQVTVEAIAKAFDRKPRRIQQLVKEGMPKGERGKYDLGACLLWYVRYLHKKIESQSAEGEGAEGITLNDQRVRGLKAGAELKELEVQLRRGEIVRVDDVRQMLSEMILMTKARLLAIPPRLAVEVLGEESRVMVQAKIEKSIKEALTQLADDGSNYASRKSNR
jgi:phage terminase Nu1 subunit (DNA packaging protein)